MGAVQKLATVVIIGLVALATVLVVYLADESGRRGGETTEQEALALERGTSLYITYCLQCHGPAGLGRDGQEDPARIGAPLNQAHLVGTDQEPSVLFQSDDPVQQDLAQRYIQYMITYGIPQDPRQTAKLMPAFGQELNIEEINDLVYLITHGDWNYVYNESLLVTGHNTAQSICDAPAPATGTPSPADEEARQEACENAHNEDYVLYPTVPPPTAEPGAEEGGDATPAAEGEGGVLLEAQDPYSWSETELTVKPGDTIQVVNSGLSNHDFVVDEWGIEEALTSGAEPVTITIPEDAAPGDYEFYCSIPGHKENGMVGTITVEAP